MSGSTQVKKVAASSSTAMVNYSDEEEEGGEVVPLQQMVEADRERKEKIQIVQQVRFFNAF